MAVKFKLNGVEQSVDASPDTPLLWVIRDHLQLTGTKFGCGIAQCGACTVHLGGNPIRSCSTPLSVAEGQEITTIEGNTDRVGQAVKKAWESHAVVQCGYCQSGQMMAATALLNRNKQPSDSDIDAAMSGNICRCHTYVRIRAAIKTAAQDLA